VNTVDVFSIHQKWKGNKVQRTKERDETIRIIIHICTWKCHSETPYRAILNKKISFFFKKREQTQSHQKQRNKLIKNITQESKTGLVWGLVTLGAGRIISKGL
jgi:hypothetical protein